MGDELESIVAAVAGAQVGLAVTVIRRSTDWLGGLSTRGGLSYMDITPECLSPLFKQLITEAGLQRVALEPERANTVMQQWLASHEVRLISGIQSFTPQADSSGCLSSIHIRQADGSETTLSADFFLDTTPDADLAGACGVPYEEGVGQIFGLETPTLGVSPVFQIEGVSAQAFADAEQALRLQKQTKRLLTDCLPHHPAELRQAWLTREPIVGVDYLDILNPTLGAYYHDWRFGKTVCYDEASFWIDGANISCLTRADGSTALGFNGLVGRVESLKQQLALSREEKPIPETFLKELQAVERFFQTVMKLPQATIIPPKALYVRQTIRCEALKPFTYEQIQAGGVPEAESVGHYSYWLDFRGINGWKVCPDRMPWPKPSFRVGLKACLPKDKTRLGRLAFLGRSAGYDVLSQGACRIVQHNALLAETLVPTIGQALKQGKAVHDIPPHRIEPVSL